MNEEALLDDMLTERIPHKGTLENECFAFY
jgi:hypothetical protein